MKKTQISEEISPKEYYTWSAVELLVKKLVNIIQRLGRKYDVILAITNGGIIPARLIARELNINHIQADTN